MPRLSTSTWLLLPLALLLPVAGSATDAVPPLPSWRTAGYERPAALFFGANATGLESQQQMRHQTEFALVGWGWQQDNANCITSSSRGACQRDEAAAGEHQAAAFTRFRKASAVKVATEAAFVYRHSQLALDWYSLDREAVYSVGHEGWFISDGRGLCRENDGGYHWNFSNAYARAYWVENVIGEVAAEGRAAGISAVFLDEGDSTYCGYSFKTKTNCTGTAFSRETLVQMYRGKLLALRAAAALLNKRAMVPIISMHARWMSSAHCSCALCFDEIYESLSSVSWLKFYEYFGVDVDGGDRVAAVLWGRLKEGGLLSGKDAVARRLPAVMHSPINSKIKAMPKLLDYAVTAWQLTRGEYDYFGASTGWLDGKWKWLPQYQLLGDGCGAPLGVPEVSSSGAVWTRRFARCTVVVDTDNQTGTIRPISGPSVPPPPPSPVGERVDVFSPGDDGVPCHRIPTLVTLPDRSLLAIVQARSWLGDNCFPATTIGKNGIEALKLDNTTSIVLRKSQDGGISWGPTVVVVSGKGLSYGGGAAVSLDSNGSVAVTVCTGVLVGDSTCSSSLGGNALVISRSGGNSWGKPQPLKLTNGNMCAPWNPTAGLLIDQRVLWVGHAREQGTRASYGAVWATPSDGSPTLLQQPVLLKGLDEAQMVLVGGHLPAQGPASVFLSSRNPRGLGTNYPKPSPGEKLWGTRLFARSSDAGHSWFDVGKIDGSSFPDPRCQGAIASTRTGDYFLSHASAMPAARYNLTVRATRNLTGGPHWGAATVIEPGGAAYSSLSIIDTEPPAPASVGVLYERACYGCESKDCDSPHSPLGNACSSCRVTFRSLRIKTEDQGTGSNCRSPPSLGYACAATRCEVAVEALCGHTLRGGSCKVCNAPSDPTQRSKLHLVGCTERYIDILCANNRNKSAKQFMTEVFDLSLASGPQWARCRAALAIGNYSAALDEWRDQTILLLGHTDFLQFSWHDNVRNPTLEDPVRVMEGNMTRAAEFAAMLVDKREPGFVDLQGIHEGNHTHPIAANRWFCDITNTTLWPQPWPFKKSSHTTGLPQGMYAGLKSGWEEFSSLAWASNGSSYWRHRYTSSYIEHVRQLFQAHFPLFWLREKERYDSHPSYCGGEFSTNSDQLNWNPEDNHLGESTLAQNWIQSLGLLAKTAMTNQTRNWDDVLGPVAIGSTLATPEYLPADALSQMVEAFLDTFHYVVLPFATSSNSVPNQASTGILGMMWIGNAFGTTKKGALIKSAVDAALEALLADMAEPDGGLLEQSFNYHKPVLALFELRSKMDCSLVSTDAVSLAQCKWLSSRCKAALRRNTQLQQSLLAPTGNQPQVGNNADAGCSTFDTTTETQSCSMLDDPVPVPPANPTATSAAYPWTGYYVQRDSWAPNALWAFFYPVVHPGLNIPRGHINSASNSIQVAAFGRQLFVSGGAPAYGRPVPVATYLSEQSVLKHCTVAPLNSSGVPAEQAFPTHDGKDAPTKITVYTHAAAHLQTDTLWGHSPAFDIGRSSYTGGYIGIQPRNLTHTRAVIFIRGAKLWLIDDQVTGGINLTYSQIWGLAPPGNGGFQRSDVDISGFADTGVVRTTEHGATNVEMHVFATDIETEHSLRVQAFNGSMEPAQLGWYGQGIGSFEEKTDVHVHWTPGTRNASLISAIVPIPAGGSSPVISTTKKLQEGMARGFSLALRDGTTVKYMRQPDQVAGTVSLADKLAASATTIVAHTNGTVTRLLVLGCTQLTGVQDLRSPNFFATVDSESGAVLGQLEYIFDSIAPSVQISGGGVCSINSKTGFIVRYTLDERDPTTESALYTAPFTVSSAVNVRARFFDTATHAGLLPVATAAYSPKGPMVYRRAPDTMNSRNLQPGIWFWSKLIKGYVRVQQAARTICYRANFTKDEEGTEETVSLAKWRGQTNQLIRFSGLLEISSTHAGVYEIQINTSRAETTAVGETVIRMSFFGGDADVYLGYGHRKWDLQPGFHRFHVLLHLQDNPIVDTNILIWRRLTNGVPGGEWQNVPAKLLWREATSPCPANRSDALPVYKSDDDATTASTSSIVGGNLLVNGQPFFEWGSYTHDLQKMDWDFLHSSGYNTVLSYTNGNASAFVINTTSPVQSDFGHNCNAIKVWSRACMYVACIVNLASVHAIAVRYP
jgi:hypothetical protein